MSQRKSLTALLTFISSTTFSFGQSLLTAVPTGSDPASSRRNHSRAESTCLKNPSGEWNEITGSRQPITISCSAGRKYRAFL